MKELLSSCELWEAPRCCLLRLEAARIAPVLGTILLCIVTSSERVGRGLYARTAFIRSILQECCFNKNHLNVWLSAYSSKILWFLLLLSPPLFFSLLLLYFPFLFFFSFFSFFFPFSRLNDIATLREPDPLNLSYCSWAERDSVSSICITKSSHARALQHGCHVPFGS